MPLEPLHEARSKTAAARMQHCPVGIAPKGREQVRQPLVFPGLISQHDRSNHLMPARREVVPGQQPLASDFRQRAELLVYDSNELLAEPVEWALGVQDRLIIPATLRTLSPVRDKHTAGLEVSQG